MTASHQPRLLDYVNPLQGTDTDRSFSRGNTLPLVARPFGMTHWSAQTDEGKWLFQRRAATLQGVRATHQPSPWIGDYANFVVMPTNGPLITDAPTWASYYQGDRGKFAPDRFSAFLLRYRIGLELTATDRCSVIRARFPVTEGARFVLKPFSEDSEIAIDSASGCVTCSIKETGRALPGFPFYFVAVANKPVTNHGIFDDDGLYESAESHSGKRAGAYIGFDASEEQTVTLRIGTSFISVEQARLNLEREIGDRGFDEIEAESAGIWERELGRIEIEGATDAQRATFYTCLYRAFLFPRMLHEFDAAGRMVHFSPYDFQVHEGELYTDNGFWDTYRTVYSFLALVAPERLNAIMRGWTNGAKEGGWYPRWASPGFRNCMIGTHMDNIVPDAYLRGCRDFDIEAAYRAIRRDAFEVGSPTGGYGRGAVESYMELGYVPAEEAGSSASRTQDYAYNDWGVAQIARELGYDEDARLLYQRAMNYRNAFDSSIGFMRGRNRDGSWLEPFDEFAWGHEYVEGGVWQNTWAVQHDPAGLIELMGGVEAFVAKLDRMLSLPPVYKAGSYRREIHEMAEMAAVDFGQYAHSNQPVHHVLYLYAAAGKPWKTEYWVRRVMNELYSADDLCGDEDNGEMCCWYLLNTLGIFPLCPGHPSFVLGSPLFAKATVHLENGKTLTVEAPDNSEGNVYVSGVKLNGADHTKTWVAHDDLACGGALTFAMCAEPATERSFGPEELPYSLSSWSGTLIIRESRG